MSYPKCVKSYKGHNRFAYLTSDDNMKGEEKKNQYTTLYMYDPSYKKKGFTVYREGWIEKYMCHYFMHFDSDVDYFNFIERLVPVEERNFFEVVDNMPLKPHFDIDLKYDKFLQEKGIMQGELTEKQIQEKMDLEYLLTISHIVKACKEIFAEKNIILKDEINFVLCTSHGEDIRSAHLVIDGYAHTDADDSKALYYLVKERVPLQHHRWMDVNVYKKSQQWRLVNNQKVDSGRIKTFQPKWVYLDENDKKKEVNFKVNHRSSVHPTLYIYTATLLRPNNYTMLPSFKEDCKEINNNKQKQPNYNYSNNNEMSEEWKERLEDLDDVDLKFEDVENVIEMICNVYGYDLSSPPVSYINYGGNKINFRNLTRYECKICGVVHENQNPLVYVTKCGNAFMDCRRSEAHIGENKIKLHLGKLFYVNVEDKLKYEEEEEDLILSSSTKEERKEEERKEEERKEEERKEEEVKVSLKPLNAMKKEKTVKKVRRKKEFVVPPIPKELLY